MTDCTLFLGLAWEGDGWMRSAHIFLDSVEFGELRTIDMMQGKTTGQWQGRSTRSRETNGSYHSVAQVLTLLLLEEKAPDHTRVSGQTTYRNEWIISYYIVMRGQQGDCSFA